MVLFETCPDDLLDNTKPEIPSDTSSESKFENLMSLIITLGLFTLVKLILIKMEVNTN
jgi:hypothetical protein